MRDSPSDEPARGPPPGFLNSSGGVSLWSATSTRRPPRRPLLHAGDPSATIPIQAVGLRTARPICVERSDASKRSASLSVPDGKYASWLGVDAEDVRPRPVLSVIHRCSPRALRSAHLAFTLARSAGVLGQFDRPLGRFFTNGTGRMSIERFLTILSRLVMREALGSASPFKAAMAACRLFLCSTLFAPSTPRAVSTAVCRTLSWFSDRER
jgi:hypothetical protein